MLNILFIWDFAESMLIMMASGVKLRLEINFKLRCLLAVSASHSVIKAPVWSRTGDLGVIVCQ